MVNSHKISKEKNKNIDGKTTENEEIGKWLALKLKYIFFVLSFYIEIHCKWAAVDTNKVPYSSLGSYI